MWINRSVPASSALETRQHLRHSSSTKRALLISSVSAQTPEYFHIGHVNVLPGPAIRCSQAKFGYEDMRESRDLSNVRPKMYYDMLKEKNLGMKYRLPYYQSYYRSLAKEGFGIKEGMCGRQIQERRVEIRRDESQFLQKLRRSSSSKSRHLNLVKATKNSFETMVQFIHEDSYGRLPGVTSVKLRSKRSPSSPSVDMEDTLRSIRDIDEFDRKQRKLKKDKPTE
jgi:hypothetical protein